MPSSPRAWINFAVSVRERHERAHSIKYEYTGFGDRRSNDLRETSIDVLMMAERSSHAVCGNGVGYRLMLEHLVEEKSWMSFSEREQSLLRRVEREFQRRLVKAEFLPEDKDRG